METTKSYKWYLENGCQIVPLQRNKKRDKNFALALLDIQADFSDLFLDISEKKKEDIVASEGFKNVFYKQSNAIVHKDAQIQTREKYVYEMNQLWAYIEWHYNFEDEIKVQKGLIPDLNKLVKVPRLYVSTHIIDGAINKLSENENICILKYTTYTNFSERYGKDQIDLKVKNSTYNNCNFVYEVCDIAEKSLLFANSPVINTTTKNVLSITKSGKKREDFNQADDEEEEEKVKDEVWQVYISNKIQSINDQWLLICVDKYLREMIENPENVYFKTFNKYIRDYSEFIRCHDYDDAEGGEGKESKYDKKIKMYNRLNQIHKKCPGYEKFSVNLIFSENKDITYIMYKLCLEMGQLNDVILCTKNRSYNILMNDIDGTLAICFKSFLSKYYKNTVFASSIGEENEDQNNERRIGEDEDDLIKTISIMGLCKEKMLVFQRPTIFSNIELLYSYYLIVHSEALQVKLEGETEDDGILYLSKKALYENIQFSNEEISSYLLHLQKYNQNNLLYIRGKGFRYVKNEIIYEFLIKLLEFISLDDSLYEYQPVDKTPRKNPLFSKYQEDVYKVQKQKYGITFENIFKIVSENISEFQLLQMNKLPVEKHVLLQLCLKACDIENRHFEYAQLYYNYYFFYKYLDVTGSDFELSFEQIFEEYLQFLENDDYIDETTVHVNLFKLHKLMSYNVIRTSGKVEIYSDTLFSFDLSLDRYVKYMDQTFKNLNSNLMDKIIHYFIKNYQFFLEYGYDKKRKRKSKIMQSQNGDVTNKDQSNENNNNNNEDNDLLINKYRDRVFFRHNNILQVNNINHICNDEYMFQYFIVVKYYYNDNNFGILETKLKKFIKRAEEDFLSSHQKSVEFDINKKMKTNWQQLRSNYCLNYKIYKYQTIPFPHIRLHNNYNDLLNMVYSPLSLHFSILHENVIYKKKENLFELIPTFLLRDNLRSALSSLFQFKKSYYAQELYPFLNPILSNKDMIGTIAVPPLRHCRTKLVEKENEKNVEFLGTSDIVTVTFNNDIKNYSPSKVTNKVYLEKTCKLYNCNLPVSSFSF